MIRVDIDDGRGQRMLRDLRGRFIRLMPATAGRMRRLIHEAAQKQFDSEGAWGGTPWQPLSPITVAEKTRAGYGGKRILQRTGRMYDAFTGRSNDDVQERITRGSYTLVVTDPKAKYHQKGSEDGRLPKREILPEPMPDSFMRDLKRIVSGYLVGVELR